MKRTVLLPIGIASATILVLMALWILLTGTFYLFPTITVDPVGGDSVDEQGILVLTGTTNLGLNTYLLVNVSPASGKDGAYDTEITSVSFGSGGRNSWRAVMNTSALPPGTYSVRVSDIMLTEGGRTILPGAVTATAEISLAGRPASGPVEKEPYLRINTVGPTAAGEVIYITGTTNLPPSTEVAWRIEPVSCLQKNRSAGEPLPATTPVAEGRTQVTQGIAGVQRWSFSLDSSGMATGCCRIDASANTVAGTAEFTLAADRTGIGLPPARIITIDTFPDPPVNTMVVLTGTTSLPAGEELLVSISPDKGSGYDFLVNPYDRSQGASFSGTVGTVAVEAGAGGVNLWSMDLDTYRLQAGKYQVEVSNTRINATTFQAEEGDVSAAVNFTIRGEGP